MSYTFDQVHWQRVAGGLQVSAGARDLNYPQEADVRSGVVYSYDADRTGTLIPGGEPPAVPVLTALDSGDGSTAVFSLSGADADTVNTLYASLLAGGAWTAHGTFVLASDGAGALTATLGKGSYWAYVVSDGDGGRSSSRPVNFCVTSSDEEDYAQLRRELRSRVLASGLLTGRLSSVEAVYLDRAPESAGSPRIVFTEGRAQNTGGGREWKYTLSVYAATRSLLDSLCELTRAAVVDGGGFTTSAWSVREVQFTGQTVQVPEESGGAAQLYVCDLGFTLFAYPAAQALTLTKDGTTLTLPPPQEDLALTDLRWQATDLALSGERYVYDRGAGDPVLALPLRAVNESERAALRAFFQNTACGRQNLFTVLGVTGGPYTARFAESELVWTRNASGTYAITLKLELQG